MGRYRAIARSTMLQEPRPRTCRALGESIPKDLIANPLICPPKARIRVFLQSQKTNTFSHSSTSRTSPVPTVPSSACRWRWALWRTACGNARALPECRSHPDPAQASRRPHYLFYVGFCHTSNMGNGSGSSALSLPNRDLVMVRAPRASGVSIPKFGQGRQEIAPTRALARGHGRASGYRASRAISAAPKAAPATATTAKRINPQVVGSIDSSPLVTLAANPAPRIIPTR